MLEDVIKAWGGQEVTAMDVYKDMFHLGEGYLQRENVEKGGYKANAIAYWRNEEASHGHYRVLFEDAFESWLPELQAADFCIVNGITYFGRKNVMDHASKMFAMIFDLDGVTDVTLNNFFNGAFEANVYPIPNYMALSGHGIHLYYCFEEPISLFPNLKIQLKELKFALTERLWNSYTSTSKSRQIQGINQGFRVIGGKTKKDAQEKTVRAFRVNSHPYSLEMLSNYVPDAMNVDKTKLFKESRMSLQEAKKRYPEWYERVVVNKDKNVKRWRIEEKVHGTNPYALYDWWMRKIYEGAAYNHRYFCIMCLVIYGIKCNVPIERVEEDAYGLIPFLNALNPSEPFTESDVKSALECYDLRYATFPLKDIETLSAIKIERNKRNGRKQELHLARARAVQAVDDPEGNWRNRKGRPDKKRMIEEYVADHPEASVSQVSEALGVSRTTVYKYKESAMQKKKDLDNDIAVILDNGNKVIVERNKAQSDLSEYDQMRLERLKKYKEMMDSLQNEKKVAGKSDKIK